MSGRQISRRAKLFVVAALVPAAAALANGAADRGAPSNDQRAANVPDRAYRPPISEFAGRAPDTTAATGAVDVRSVTDGDTIRLADGRAVRLAQVDAPETSDCFGAESTEALRKLLDGKPVELRQPSNGPKLDQYGRTLAEVSVDGVSLNESLVRDGAAEWFEQYANEDADIARRLSAAEQEARSDGRGLWSACRGGRTAPQGFVAPSAPAPPPPLTPKPASPTASVEPPAPAPAANCSPAYPGTCIPPAPPDLDCGDIGRRVVVDHRHGDPHRLDSDGDGAGCESYG